MRRIVTPDKAAFLARIALFRAGWSLAAVGFGIATVLPRRFKVICSGLAMR
jgi:hypothetical protein